MIEAVLWIYLASFICWFLIFCVHLRRKRHNRKQMYRQIEHILREPPDARER